MRTVQPFGCWLFASSLSLRFASRRCPLASFSCAYKKEVAPPREMHQNFSFLSPPVPISALLLSSSSRLVACTVSRDSRPPKPHLLSPVREKGDKVFGERSARLLTSSSRTPRTPTTTSLTSTTSSTTWRTPTPSPVPLLRLLSSTCSCFSY